MKAKILALMCVTALAATAATVVASRSAPAGVGHAAIAHGVSAVSLTRLVTGLAGGSGSTVGPDGALYVTEPGAGKVSRVDPGTGAVTTFASGLPPSLIGLGGAMDVAFIGQTAYVIVTLVGPDVGGSDTVGLYRIEGPTRSSVIADIGAFALAHPPATPFDVPTGVQYAMQPFRGGFLVTDGHHNRVLQVQHNGDISELIQFRNIVPTGLALSGNTIFMTEAGPVPHLPENGKVVTFGPRSRFASELASGAPLLVDVEFGPDGNLYALSQGIFPAGGPPGSPATPDTGSLVKVTRAGTLEVIQGGLDRPTSLEFIGNTAFVVTLDGEIWRIDDVPGGGGHHP
jgi:sugar lactone lactonase YvrE